MNGSYEEYEALPGIRASDLNLILRSPAHYKYAKENKSRQVDSAALRFGRLVHTAVLEPKLFNCEVFSGDRRKNADKARYEELLASGKEIVTAEDLEAINGISEAVHAHPAAFGLLMNTEHEVSRTKDTSKARIDMLGTNFCADLKTCRDASPRVASQSILKYGYHIQAAHYCFVTGADRFYFVFVEKDPPHLVGVYDLHFDSLQVGRNSRNDAMALLAACQENDRWPGYSNDVESINIPSFALVQEEDE